MTGTDLKSKRVAAGIAGHAVCQITGVSRSRLSDIERGYVIGSAEDLRKIDSAIDQILRTRHCLATLAMQAGLSLAGIRL